MIYLPEEWFKDPNNEERVRELLDELYSDLKFVDSLTEKEVVRELRQMKEFKVLEELFPN